MYNEIGIWEGRGVHQAKEIACQSGDRGIRRFYKNTFLHYYGENEGKLIKTILRTLANFSILPSLFTFLFRFEEILAWEGEGGHCRLGKGVIFPPFQKFKNSFKNEFSFFYPI